MSGYRIGEIFRRKGFTYRCVPESIVTEPEEGMLFRASNGVLYELKAFGSMDRKCGCNRDCIDRLPCHIIDIQAFGKTQTNSMHWYPVEEKKEEEKEMEEKKRHIELAVVEVDGEMVTFHVAEQTHRGDDFTPGGIPFESSNGLTLKSVGVPAASACADTVYVRGGTEGCDKRNVTVSALRFAQIMEAINEYNVTDGMGYKNQWPRPGDSYYYIDADGSVRHCRYDGDDTDNNRREVGNFFESADDATVVAERVKEVFKTSLVEK